MGKNGPSLIGESALAAILLAPSCIIFYHSLAGDAFIYLTFIRNFFTLPFSYQEHTVSFGASSPLHVLVHAPVAALLGDDWLIVSRALNDLLLIAGTVLLKRALRGGALTLLLLSLAVALNTTLLATTAQLFESGLIFAALSLLYLLVKHDRVSAALFVSGLLYLVRPELVLVTLALGLRLVACAPHRRRALAWPALGLLPAVLYHLYMFLMSGELVPSSAYARAIIALESGRPWIENLKLSVEAVREADGAFYLLGFAAVIYQGVARLWRPWDEAALTLPLIALYLLVPPGAQAPRYLLPISPILAALVAAAARDIGTRLSAVPRLWQTLRLRPLIAGGTAGLVALILVDGRQLPFLENPRYDEDTLLLRDLAARLNPIAGEHDRVLIYEMQAQYSLRAFCVSLDGTVGSQAIPALKREESWESFIARNGIRYLVTMESFNYRRIFDDTLLEQLYLHDRAARLGEVLESGGLRFRKILINPVYEDAGAVQEVPAENVNALGRLRVYGAANRLWAGHTPLWNAVYAVETIGAQE